MTTPVVHRYHSLDALRASMMLLGLVLHSAVSSVVGPLGAAWPYKDPQTNTAFDLVVFFKPGLDTAVSLLPPIRVLVAYGVFLAFRWLLYRRRDILERLGAQWKAPMLAGAIASVAYLVVTVGKVIGDPRLAQVAGCALAGLSIWTLIFGILGAFLRLLDRPSPIVRYLADASYWMYIVHLPIVITVPGLLAPSPLPAVVKFAITLGVTTAATLVSYHYLVRSTAIGALLNGQRYPRSLPEAEPRREVLADRAPASRAGARSAT